MVIAGKIKRGAFDFWKKKDLFLFFAGDITRG